MNGKSNYIIGFAHGVCLACFSLLIVWRFL